MPQEERYRADGVFEGGGVKGIAFAGAVAAAENECEVREWVYLAGTSAGAIVAALLAVGYDAAGLERILRKTEYPRFADYGFGGKIVGGARNALLRLRGLAPGRYFSEWLAEHLAASPLARERGKSELTFADVIRAPEDFALDVSEEERAKHKYRLRVIASDVTSGRMLVLPEDIEKYQRSKDGGGYRKDALTIVEAVRMSMSYPFLFDPVRLYRDGKPYYVVDGGLLSNFPVWLFDAKKPKRPTLGFRLHEGEGPEWPPYRKIPRPFWPLPLVKAMFFSMMDAWDAEHMGNATSVRTVSIPTRAVKTTQFGLTDDEAKSLYQWGLEEATQFFRSTEFQAYVRQIRERAAREPVPAGVSSRGLDPFSAVEDRCSALLGPGERHLE